MISQKYAYKESVVVFFKVVIEKLKAIREIVYRVANPIYQDAKEDNKEWKELLEMGKTTLYTMTDIDLSIYACYHWFLFQCHKYHQEFEVL